MATLAASTLLTAQPKKPFQSQTPSSVNYTVNKYGAGVLDISNTFFEITPNLLLRNSVKEHHEFDEIDVQASTTVEAWPLNVDIKEKPKYAIKTDGKDPRVLRGEVITILRGIEEVEWWTVYRLDTGAKLFDSYTPVEPFSIRRDELTLRYAGVEISNDETKDPRLKAANVVGVVTYASAEKVIREALLTCDDPKKAELLRSLADSKMTLTASAVSLRLSISQNYPSPSNTVTVTIPIAKDDLDFAKAQQPAGVHVAAWKR